MGESVASLSEHLDTKTIIEGLSIEETDLKHAASERYSPAHDVDQHWKNLDKEKVIARCYQALLILTLGLKNDPDGIELIKKWANSADKDMKFTSHLALIISGEVSALKALKQHARTREKQEAYMALKQAVSTRKSEKLTLKLISKDAQCSSCSRSAEDAVHLLNKGSKNMCNHCIDEVYQNKDSMDAPEDAFCDFCEASHFDTIGLYRFKMMTICDSCIQYSLGEQEKKHVEEYFEQRNS